MYKIYLHIIGIIPSNGGGIFAAVSFVVVVLVFVVAGRTQPRDGWHVSPSFQVHVQVSWHSFPYYWNLQDKAHIWPKYLAGKPKSVQLPV